jgi:penicillin amidase
MRWMGHEASDEFSAFLGVMQAKSATGFREALASYGVGGQNMLCATKSGDICQVTAAHLPIRDPSPPTDLVRKPDNPAAAWHGEADAMTLPFVLDPPKGLLATANNRAAPTPFPLGFFYPTSERVERLYALMSTKDKVTVEDLARLQQDTLSLSALALKQALLSLIKSSATEPGFVEQLQSWDGRYDADRHGPVVFEALLFELTRRLYATGDGTVPGTKEDWGYLTHYLPQDLAAATGREALINAAVTAAAVTSRKYANWGEMHRLRVGYMLDTVPLVGEAFVLDDFGVGGSRNTVMKTAHGLVNGRHYVTYGSQARQICDMADPDRNQFVLLGGEDGWLGSANFADQVALWREGHTITMPLTDAAIEAEFPTRLWLASQGRAP